METPALIDQSEKQGGSCSNTFAAGCEARDRQGKPRQRGFPPSGRHFLSLLGNIGKRCL